MCAGGLRMLIYSGDVDGIVPVVGTRRWTAGLGLETLSPWRQWCVPLLVQGLESPHKAQSALLWGGLYSVHPAVL